MRLDSAYAANQKRNPKGAAAREPVRSLAEFATEIGMSAKALGAMKRNSPDFPVLVMQSTFALYLYSDLKAWWAARGAKA